ncbi:hypothetical protein [Kiloniella sp.]
MTTLSRRYFIASASGMLLLRELGAHVERQPLCPVASTTLAAFDAAVI